MEKLSSVAKVSYLARGLASMIFKYSRGKGKYRMINSLVVSIGFYGRVGERHQNKTRNQG